MVRAGHTLFGLPDGVWPLFRMLPYAYNRPVPDVARAEFG